MKKISKVLLLIALLGSLLVIGCSARRGEVSNLEEDATKTEADKDSKETTDDREKELNEKTESETTTEEPETTSNTATEEIPTEETTSVGEADRETEAPVETTPVAEPLSYKILEESEDYVSGIGRGYADSERICKWEYPVFEGGCAEKLNSFVQDYITNIEKKYANHEYGVEIMMESERWICLKEYNHVQYLAGGCDIENDGESYLFNKTDGELVPLEHVLSEYGISSVTQVIDYMADKYARINAEKHFEYVEQYSAQELMEYMGNEYTELKSIYNDAFAKSGEWGLTDKGLYVYVRFFNEYGDSDTSYSHDDSYEIHEISYEGLLSLTEKNSKCDFYFKDEKISFKNTSGENETYASYYASYPVFTGCYSNILNKFTDAVRRSNFEDIETASEVIEENYWMDELTDDYYISITVNNEDYIGFKIDNDYVLGARLNQITTTYLFDKSTWQEVEITELLNVYGVTYDELKAYAKEKLINAEGEYDASATQTCLVLTENGFYLYFQDPEYGYDMDECEITFAELEKMAKEKNYTP